MPTVNQTSSVGSVASGTSVTPTFTNPVTSGNGIIVLVGLNTNNISSVTDDKGNTYTSVRSQNFFGSNTAAIYYVASVSNGPTVITVTTSANDSMVAVCIEVWGTLSTDVGNGTNANNATQQTGSFTTSSQNTIVVGADASSSQPSDADAWTEDAHAQSVSLKHLLQTGSATLNPKWTVSLSSPFACVAESFKSTSEGPPEYIFRRRVQPEFPVDLVTRFDRPVPISLWTGAPQTVSPWFPARLTVAAQTPPREGDVVRVYPVALWTGGASNPLVWIAPRIVRQPIPERFEEKFTHLPYPVDVRARPVVGPGLGLKREKIKRVPASSDPNFLNRLTSHAAQVAARLNSLVDRGRLFATGPANDQWEVRAKANADTRNPGALDDEMAGFGVGDAWMNATTGKMFFCQDNTTNAAKWIGPIG